MQLRGEEMRIENEKDWIDIEFKQYAKENEFVIQGLVDEENCVEIDFDFNIENDGWGCVGDEFFYTKDIKAIATGFSRIVYGINQCFEYSGHYPYKSLIPDPFYKFNIVQNEKMIVFSLTIHDRLSDYITVTETMELSKFEQITNEFIEAAKKFPIK